MSSEKNLKLILLSLLMTLLLTSLDNTIVATALGAIVADLGELEKFTWVTSFYMIAGMPSMLIFGKLSDMYGRKRFYMTGLITFLGSSILCGTADSMLQLSIYRALQGVGGGALMPISFTIIFDCYPPEKRGKIMALFGAVFGISSLFGPIIGAYLPQYVGWEWIFFINIPIGIVSGVLLFVFYHESHGHQKQKIDWLGTVLLIATICAIMILLLFGGSEFQWLSFVSGALFGVALLFGVLLWRAEVRAHTPILPLHLFKSRLFSMTQIISMSYGMVFISLLIYMPLFIQGVLNLPISDAGMVLMPMMLGVVAGAQLGGHQINRFSFRSILLVSIIAVIASLCVLPLVFDLMSRTALMVYLAFAGAAVGVNFSIVNVSSIHGVDYSSRGSANSSVIFFRQTGMAVGVTLYGIVFNYVVFNGLETSVSLPFSLDQVHTLLNPDVRAGLSGDVLAAISQTFYAGVSAVYMMAIIPAVLAFIAIIRMGGERNAQ